jgi:hypothetical protein
MLAKETIVYDGANETYRTQIHYIRQDGRHWVVCPDGSTDVMFTGDLHDCIQAALEVEEDL